MNLRPFVLALLLPACGGPSQPEPSGPAVVAAQTAASATAQIPYGVWRADVAPVLADAIARGLVDDDASVDGTVMFLQLLRDGRFEATWVTSGEPTHVEGTFEARATDAGDTLVFVVDGSTHTVAFAYTADGDMVLTQADGFAVAFSPSRAEARGVQVQWATEQLPVEPYAALPPHAGLRALDAPPFDVSVTMVSGYETQHCNRWEDATFYALDANADGVDDYLAHNPCDVERLGTTISLWIGQDDGFHASLGVFAAEVVPTEHVANGWAELRVLHDGGFGDLEYHYYRMDAAGVYGVTRVTRVGPPAE